MAGPTDAALNLAADAIADAVTNVSLHDADPGTAGDNEITGGSYARQAPTYADAAAGDTDLTGDLVFDVASGVTVSHYGLWAGSTFLGGQTCTSATFSNAGTYTLSAAPIEL